MNFWEFLNSIIEKLPGWPSEKQLVMLTTFGMGFMMIIMARNDPALWNIELFKTLITVVIVTGCINMILSFYFTANKADEQRAVTDTIRAETTGKAFDAIAATATANNTSTTDDSTAIHTGDLLTVEKQ